MGISIPTSTGKRVCGALLDGLTINSVENIQQHHQITSLTRKLYHDAVFLANRIDYVIITCDNPEGFHPTFKEVSYLLIFIQSD